jgi:hypothetical protein
MSKSDGLNAEVHRLREILEKVDDPYHRYQLTLLLETAARFFVSRNAEHSLDTTRGGKRKWKRNRDILPN